MTFQTILFNCIVC